MEAVGQANIRRETVLGVLKEWPNFNHHTDFTAMISASAPEDYQTYIWST